MLITDELKDRFLIDYRYHLTPDFARQVEKMTNEIMEGGRNGERTWCEVFQDSTAIVLEWAAVEAFGCKLLTFKKDAADVVDPVTGYRIDCKTQVGEFWDLRPEHLDHLYNNMEDVDLILTGTYSLNRHEGYADVRFKRLIDPRSIFKSNRQFNERYAPESQVPWKQDKGWHFYDHRVAIRDGYCARR